jgi:hypothetical protein
MNTKVLTSEAARYCHRVPPTVAERGRRCRGRASRVEDRAKSDESQYWLHCCALGDGNRAPRTRLKALASVDHSWIMRRPPGLTSCSRRGKQHTRPGEAPGLECRNSQGEKNQGQSQKRIIGKRPRHSADHIGWCRQNTRTPSCRSRIGLTWYPPGHTNSKQPGEETGE